MRSLRLGSRPTEPKPNEYAKLRHTTTSNLQNPRFTKDQWDKLTVEAASTEHLAEWAPPCNTRDYSDRMGLHERKSRGSSAATESASERQS